MNQSRRTLLLLPVLLPGALLLARCAPAPKPPPVLTLTMVGSADQNPDPSGNAAPVAVKVYELQRVREVRKQRLDVADAERSRDAGPG